MRLHHRRGPFIALAIVLALALTATVVGVAGLIAGPAHSTSTRTSHPGPPSPARPARTATPEDLALPNTDHPVPYARAVARAVFDWDTTSTVTPEDSTSGIVADADPSGLETPGLIADLSTYLPTDEVWQELRTYQTRETVIVDSARIPPDWAEIVAQGGSDIQHGTVAVTITATRHRTGIWQGQVEHADDPVSFTAFVICTPTYPACHVLRLSQLNDPLK